MNNSPSALSNANKCLVTRSAIGEANVVNMMSEINAIIGGEGNDLRLDWTDRWVQVRASNTEPIVPIIAEAPEESVAQGLIDETRKLIELLM